MKPDNQLLPKEDRLRLDRLEELAACLDKVQEVVDQGEQISQLLCVLSRVSASEFAARTRLLGKIRQAKVLLDRTRDNLLLPL